jgi:hypothetical protein
MRSETIRPIPAVIFAAAVCLAVSPPPDAGATSAFVERFVARAPGESDPAATSYIEILIQRWSTDEERDDLRGTLLERGPDALLSAVQKVLKRPAGVVVIPGIPGAGARVRTRQARNVLFARDLETPKGRQVIIVTDQYLAFGEPTKDWPSDYQFTLLDIRFGPDGTGTGKLAPPAKVVYNKETKIIELDNYVAQPVRLIGVRSETTATRSRREGTFK